MTEWMPAKVEPPVRPMTWAGTVFWISRREAPNQEHGLHTRMQAVYIAIPNEIMEAISLPRERIREIIEKSGPKLLVAMAGWDE